MSVDEFVKNVVELYTFIVLNLNEELGDENLIAFVATVKNTIEERGE